ncbi:MAG: hypothetical protein WDO13_00170 [Verrucomicrobiota bacterium]
MPTRFHLSRYPFAEEIRRRFCWPVFLTSEGGIHMQHDQKQLHQIAQDYPWYTFTVEEIALLCNVSRDVVSKVRSATDHPFFLNKCRPEWFTAWMRGHPDFQLTKALTLNAPSQESCMKAGQPDTCAQPHHSGLGQLSSPCGVHSRVQKSGKEDLASRVAMGQTQTSRKIGLVGDP